MADDASLPPATACALCGHDPACGSAAGLDANDRQVPLCHADDHSCYHRWTLYRERPPADVQRPMDPVRELLRAGQIVGLDPHQMLQEVADVQRPTPPLTERVWCKRCSTYHECSDEHGPDGHGGSSVCCPVRKAELATGYARERVNVQRPELLTEEELAEIDRMVERFPDHHILPVAVSRMRRLIADLRAAREEARTAYDRGHSDGYDEGHAAASVEVADEAIRQMQLLRKSVGP